VTALIVETVDVRGTTLHVLNLGVRWKQCQLYIVADLPQGKAFNLGYIE
jgi:hypothetical protein